MKRMFLSGMAALAVAFAATAVTACPNDEKVDSGKDGSSLVSGKAKAPCSNAKTVSTSTDGRSESAGTAPCSGKSATAKTVADEVSPCGKGCKKGCCGKGAKTVSAKGGCPIAAKTQAVLASLPNIEYRVGSEVIGCSKSAAAAAEKSGKPIEYVIGSESFSHEGEAKARLTALLEEAVTDLQSVQYAAGGKCGRCPVTAKSIAKSTGTRLTYRVGGVDFESKDDAEKVARLVSDAAKDVSLTYMVDGKTYKCDKTAGEKCKKSGKKLTYVVGEQETGCETSAKLMLVQAKVRKIVETASAASFSL